MAGSPKSCWALKRHVKTILTASQDAVSRCFRALVALESVATPAIVPAVMSVRRLRTAVGIELSSVFLTLMICVSHVRSMMTVMIAQIAASPSGEAFIALRIATIRSVQRASSVQR